MMKIEVAYTLRIGEETFTFNREELRELHEALRVIFGYDKPIISHLSQPPIYREPGVWSIYDGTIPANKKYTEVTCQSLERNL